MHEGENEDFVGLCGVQYCVREASDEASADAVPDFHPQAWILFDQGNRRFDFIQEGRAESLLDVIVVVDGLEELPAGLRGHGALHASALARASARTPSTGMG